MTANLAAGDLGTAVSELETIVAGIEMPVGTTAAVSGQSDDMSDSFRSLQFTMLLAVFLVYLVMASQFESLLHPFVILLTIPLALTGSVWAMFLTGTTVNVVAYIGLIMLAGIVVNQSIVLIDAVNQARERGLAEARGNHGSGPHAPAPDRHHQADDDSRPAADGDRARRGRGNPQADGDHRDRWRRGRELLHAAGDPGRLFPARPQAYSRRPPQARYRAL